MELTPEQQKLGKENFSTAVSVSRRDFLKGAVAGSTGLGAAYFGYEELKGEPVRTAFIGTGDEGNILLSEHPPKFMDVVAIADLRPSNQKRAIHGDGNDARIGLIRKVGQEKAGQVKIFDSHKDLLAAKDELGIEAVVIAVPLNQHQPIGLECLDAGLHVLTEKLMAHNIKQCKEWIRKAREKNLLLAVGHQRHYSVLYDNAASLVHDGLLGDIKFIRAQWHRNNSFPNSDQWNPGIKKEDMEALEGKVQEFGYESVEQLVRWRLFNGTGGGLMAELGSHQMDAASIFLGHVHPIAVSGYGGKNFYGVKGVGSSTSRMTPRHRRSHLRDLRVPRSPLRGGSKRQGDRHLLVDQYQPFRALRRMGLREPRDSHYEGGERSSALQGGRSWFAGGRTRSATVGRFRLSWRRTGARSLRDLVRLSEEVRRQRRLGRQHLSRLHRGDGTLLLRHPQSGTRLLSGRQAAASRRRRPPL
ncbi:MAG: Gfo/Idh/MocA family oxidoreductase [Planctomycetaceae bacterium]